MTTRRRLRHSIVGRVALGALVLSLVAAAVLFAVAYGTVSAVATNGLQRAVDTDLAGLADIAATGGAADLTARIADRLAMTPDDSRQSHYLLIDAAGRKIAGDLTDWPASLSADRSDAGYLALPDGTRLYARATRLSPNLALVVGRDDRPERALLDRLTISFALASLVVVLTVSLLTWRNARTLSDRIDRIGAALRTGDSAAMEVLVEDAGQDELAEVTRRSGVALRRMQALAVSYRQVSDHVAHEIRTPLAHLDRRLLDLRESADGRTVDRARQDIADIVRLLESLLDIAASEAQRDDPSGMTELDIAGIARELADLYDDSMEDAGLSLETNIGAPVPMRGDAMQLRRMLTNLLDNAVKYVPPGGLIRLSVRAGPTIIIEDDGPGIPVDRRPTIFDRFVRGNAGTNGQGHGLGLTLARAIAERHGLTMMLDDAPRGCRFRIAPGLLS
ncbi:HAMP domain-containing sensor histidine kinase [uncultured Sphingomonas sp.]|uniref:sensor histidine kinase n=1 Tax=uncultured Sphingomonas sp. TaxID=158754 RepID=UPI0025FD2925|nr:HAMP domain-containing sensor histidine kinase [uncultured Sphingomonas sp.]